VSGRAVGYAGTTLITVIVPEAFGEGVKLFSEVEINAVDDPRRRLFRFPHRCAPLMPNQNGPPKSQFPDVASATFLLLSMYIIGTIWQWLLMLGDIGFEILTVAKVRLA